MNLNDKFIRMPVNLKGRSQNVVLWRETMGEKPWNGESTIQILLVVWTGFSYLKGLLYSWHLKAELSIKVT